MQVLASEMSFLMNRNDLPVPLLFWPVNCIKTGGKYFISPGRVDFLRTKQYTYIEFVHESTSAQGNEVVTKIGGMLHC